MEVQKKTCENCGHYIFHYSVLYGKLTLVGGHCCAVTQKSKKTVKTDCELWKPKEERVEKEKKHIRNVILKMEKHLEEIAVILKNDIL